MTEQQSAIIAALTNAGQLSLSQISERTHIFRRQIEYQIKGLIADGRVVREVKSNPNGNYQIGLYSLPEVAIADPA